MDVQEELQSLVVQIEQLSSAAAEDEARRPLFEAAQAQALAMLSGIQWRNGALAEASASLDRAVALQPLTAWRVRRAMLLPPVPASRPDIRQARAELRSRLEALRQPPPEPLDRPDDIAWTLFLLAYHAEEDNRALHQLYHQVCLAVCPDLGWTAPHCRRPRAGGRVRVGFISWHLDDHTIARLFLRLVEEMDADSVDVTLFGFEGHMAAVQPMPGKRCLSLPRDYRAAREAIAQAGLDLLIHLDVGMDYLTQLLAQGRLARRQGLLWGHPDSTGLPSMDFFFTADCMEPDDGESHYSETLVRLPGTVALYERPVLPAGAKNRGEMGLPESAILYLCPQTAFKFHPDFDAALVEILDAVPDSRLVLLSGWEGSAIARVKQRIAAGRPDLAERILIMGQLARSDFLTLLTLCDVLLDPFHYSGGNTTLEAFAFGAPVVSWPGKFMRARHTAGFYRLMGLEDLLAGDQRQYVERAVALGRDGALRADWRRRILDRCGLLYDDRRGLWALEAFIASLSL